MRGKIFKSLFVSFFWFCFTNIVSAHSGNTDSNGGHNKTLNGTYHCHSSQCLEDAKEEAHSICYPQGLEDGEIGRKDDNYIATVYGDLDVDQDYLIKFCTDSYEMGFNETSSWWDRNYLIIVLAIIILPWVIIYKVYRSEK
jgi:hypothetical protein